MSHFYQSFHPTLRLEDGLCFTTLKNVDERDIFSIVEALEFTIWSPGCYSKKLSIPSDVLAFCNGEMRIYHTSNNEQVEKLLKTEKEAMILGFRPRTEKDFKLPGISFSEELPTDLLGISSIDLELTYHALNDLCVIINQASNHCSLLDSVDYFEETFEMMCSFLARSVRALTDELDNQQIGEFKRKILAVKGYKNRKVFFNCFFETFLSDKINGSRELFVALMVQRAQVLELFNSNEQGLDFLILSKSSLKPIISSIDLLLYKNFFEPFYSPVNMSASIEI